VQAAVFRRTCELCVSPEAARGCKSECGAIPGAGVVGHEARDAETDTLALQPSQGHPPAAKRWTLGWRAPRGGPRGCAALWEATADLLHGWHSRHVAECLPRRLPAPAAQTLTSLLEIFFNRSESLCQQCCPACCQLAASNVQLAASLLPAMLCSTLESAECCAARDVHSLPPGHFIAHDNSANRESPST